MAVAAIVWMKGWIVAKRFIAFTPLALLGTAAYRVFVG